MTRQDFNGDFQVGSQEYDFSYTATTDSLEVWMHDYEHDKCAHAIYVGKALEVLASLMFSEQARLEFANA